MKIHAKIVLITTCVVVLIAIIATALYLTNRLPEASAEITGDIVNNDYNNYLAGGNLVRIGDKLYFNYYKNPYCYGLIEISASNSERIYWDGAMWLSAAAYNYPIRNMDGKMYMQKEDGIYLYSAVTNQFSKDSFLADTDLNSQRVGDTIIYVSDDPVTKDSTAYTYDGQTCYVLCQKERARFYIDGNRLFYCQKKNVSAGRYIHEIGVYDLSHGSDNLIFIVPENYFLTSRIWVEGDHILFSASYEENGRDAEGLFKVNLNSPSLIQICDGESISLNNVYNGNVYATVEGKLLSIDIVSHSVMKLSDRNAKHCYIVDDKWVYFTEFGNDDLWRVTQLGTEEKLVYG